MQRFLTAISAAALLASVATAQCFESNFGTQIGLGDDVAFPTATTATAFTMPGFLMGATTYTHFTVNTNGVVFPTTTATGVVGATATGYSATPATQLTNLRGAVGGVPRIAPLWRDLNLLAANNGALWVNNSATKCVFTWANAVQFGSTSPIFTVQAQLFPNGDVQFFYNGTVASTVATITGISQGGAIASVPGVDLSVGPNVSATYLHYEQFAANAIDLQTTGLSFINTGTGYVQTAAACVPANNSAFGAGCYTLSDSIYQLFANAADGSAGLTNQSVSFTPAGATYLMSWGGGSYVAPGGGAVNLTTVATDDGEVVYAPSIALPTPQGPQASLRLHTNGILSWGAAALTFPGTNAWTPTAIGMLTSNNGGIYAWHDFNENEINTLPLVNSPRIVREEVVVGSDTILYVTWPNVENYSTPAANNPTTMQFQINLTTGVVTVVWTNVDTATTSTFSTAYLVGYSAPGAASLNAGSANLATALPQLVSTINAPAMSLVASGAPVSTPSSGSVVTYTSNDIPENVPGSGLYIAINVLSVVGVPAPGVDLGVIGAPGCAAYFGTLDLLQSMVGLTPSQFVTFAVPAGVPAGFELFSQSVALIAPNSLPNGQNAFGLTTSNAIRSFINAF